MTVQSCSLDFAYESFTGKSYWQSDLKAALDAPPTLHPTGPWIGGGLIRRSLLGQPINSIHADVDVFFTSEEQFKATVDRMVQYVDDGEVLSSYGDELRLPSFFVKALGFTTLVQLVGFEFVPTPEDLVERFDFSVCALVTDGKTLWYHPDTFDHLRSKQLHVSNPSRAARSLRRIDKYLRQGFSCPAETRQFLNYALEHPEEYPQGTSGIGEY